MFFAKCLNATNLQTIMSLSPQSTTVIALIWSNNSIWQPPALSLAISISILCPQTFCVYL